MTLFPIFVKLENRAVLLVGAGPIAESKIAGLLAARARVVVVAPDATLHIVQLAAEGALAWHQRTFQANDVDGMTLVVAAVPKEVAASVFAAAKERGILCNYVDDIENRDFY
jgi:precorrin-2 dehydrogenase/sirohydrochlorin ferrochelatase